MSTSNTAKPAARLGRVGIWASELRLGEASARAEAAAELDELGFGAAWIPGGGDDDTLDAVTLLLDATRRMTIATGILNIWRVQPLQVGAFWRAQSPDRKARVMLGLGVSHAPMIGDAYKKPVATMAAYLDGLDAEGVPADHRCLAALAPKMQELSKERSAGTHPYLVTPEHTAEVRQHIGPDALLAPEQGVILEADPGKARAIAREALGIYLKFPNYVNIWRRLGFSEDDVTRPSDRLLDALFAWGSMDQIVKRVNAHFDAGADHVCLQVIRGERGPVEQLRGSWRELGAALL